MARLRQAVRRSVLGLCVSLVLMTLSWFTLLAFAEGSRTLYPAGTIGNRANIEWRTSFFGTFLRRRALFKLYARAGEVILLGSSAVGVNNADIRVYHPNLISGPVGDETIPPTADFSCTAQRLTTGNSNQGRITSRAQELAGPDTITDTATASPGQAVPNGFIPCFYPVPTTGIYHVVFFGPAGGNSDVEIAPTGQINLSSPANFNAQQSTSIAAWDVTVRSALTSTTDNNGRLFMDYLPRFTGAWPRPLYSSFFVLTRDGYLYQTDMRGLDANGFVVYANNIGFLDSDGSPLYHDVLADPSLPTQLQNQLNLLQGGASLAPPTHLIFFNPPEPAAIAANNIPLTPIAPILTSFEFGGQLGMNDTFLGGGGVFTFTSNMAGTFRLIISRDGLDFSPDNPLNRALVDVHGAGIQSLVWDGLDNAGNPFPLGQNYQARLTVRAGEYHFPLLDPESSLDGGPTYTLINPPGGICPSFEGGSPNCNIGFYDDRSYTTANGTTVGTPGMVLPGINPPNPPNSDPLSGFDTTTTQRSFGDGTANGFGDKKGLDIWTYYPGQPRFTPVNILGLNLTLTKTDGGVTTAPGAVVLYSLSYANTAAITATGVTITETVPLYTTFNQGASLPTTWSCSDGSLAGTVCTTLIGPLASKAGGSVNFAVTVIDPVPAGITQIDNIAVIGEDGTRGPEPPADNTAWDNTPLLPAPTATPPADDGPTPPLPAFTPTPHPNISPSPAATLLPGTTPTGTPTLPPGISPTLTTTLLPGISPTSPIPVKILPETGHNQFRAGLGSTISRVALVILSLLLLLIIGYSAQTKIS